MPGLQIGTYRATQFAQVRDLWNEAFPDDPPRNRAEAAIPQKLAVQPDLLVVATLDGHVAGTVMAGYDGHRGWLYSLAVRREQRSRGIGRSLVREAERRLAALGCTKVNLQVRGSNERLAGFYEALGFAREERISLGKALLECGPDLG